MIEDSEEENKMANKKVLVILAEGFEEIEAITPIDVLKRAGLEVVTAGVRSKQVTGAHGIKLEADLLLSDYPGLPDAVILPGGLPGAQNLADSAEVTELVRNMNDQKKIVGAICAAPALVLAPKGILNGKKATCYPGFEKNFSNKVSFSAERVIVDGHIITSKGPGSALEFALELVRILAGAEKRETLRQGLVAK